MRLFIQPILCLFLLIACTSGNPDYKNGKFIFHLKIDGGVKYDYLIERHDSIQTEKNMQSGDISTMRIVWKDSDNYLLYFISTTANLPADILQMKKAYPLETRILYRGKSYYLFESKLQNDDKHILRDTLWLMQ